MSDEAQARVQQVLQHVGEVAREVVASEGFVGRLGQEIALRLATPWPGAIQRSQLKDPGMVAVDPQQTERGLVLMLTRLPVLGGNNLRVTAVLKDFTQPPAEGQPKLANYAVLIADERECVGDLARVQVLTQLEPDLQAELHRQLEISLQGPACFYYMQIWDFSAQQQSPEQPTEETPAQVPAQPTEE